MKKGAITAAFLATILSESRPAANELIWVRKICS